jgi:hypothetical protein
LVLQEVHFVIFGKRFQYLSISDWCCVDSAERNLGSGSENLSSALNWSPYIYHDRKRRKRRKRRRRGRRGQKRRRRKVPGNGILQQQISNKISFPGIRKSLFGCR